MSPVTPSGTKNARPSWTPSRTFWIVAGLLTVSYVIVLVRTAWFCDDAYISLRVVDNFITGNGLRWNVAERVQTCTNPLWVLLLSAVIAVTREMYVSTLVVSMCCATIAYLVVLGKLSRSVTGMVTGGLILLLAPAYVSYSTSGLENPLSFLLVTVFVLLFVRHTPGAKRSFLLGLVASLAMINRLDAACLLAPALLWEVFRNRKFLAMTAGLTPLVLWLGFALVYYGFLLPNSAYAKLYTGLDRAEYMTAGVKYLYDALQRETLASAVIVVAVVGGLLSRSGSRRVLAAGLVLHLYYIVRVGGDFMVGRFLTVPLLVSVIMLMDADFFAKRWFRIAAIPAVILLGFLAPVPTVLSGADFGKDAVGIDRNGICDERAVYFQIYGLFNGKSLGTKIGHDLDSLRVRQSNEVTQIKIIKTAGVAGLKTGPNTYLLDQFALGDALLARLAFRETVWRYGHFSRVIPSGYLLSLVTGENHIRDKYVREYYEHIRRIVRGPIFDGERWTSIVGMHTGRYDSLVRGNTRYKAIAGKDFLEVAEADVNAGGPQILWNAARYCLRRRMLDRATPILTRLSALKIAGSDDYIKEAIRNAKANARHDPQYSEDLLRLIRKLEPQSVYPAFALGVFLYDRGDVDEGIAEIRAAAGMDDTTAREWLNKHEIEPE